MTAPALYCRRDLDPVNPFDHVPAGTGLFVTRDLPGGIRARLDVWPVDGRNSGAVVLLSHDGIPVSTWLAPVLADETDTGKLWRHYYGARGAWPPNWRGRTGGA